MTREQFHQLRRGRRLRDRQGRVWTVRAAPFEEGGRSLIAIRSDDLVRRVDEHWADDYEVVPDDDDG